MMMLRFRDLTIPDGETVRRHKAIIDGKGSVWWGWIMRQHEVFPGDYIVALSRELAESGKREILLYHSGSGQFFQAQLSRVSALPGGHRIRSPQMDLTPPYMHESVCPAWFELRELDEVTPPPSVHLCRMPTLANAELANAGDNGDYVTDALLRDSGATLWEVEVGA
jgi:hypothetical protein